MRIAIVPITLAEANEFVRVHHRHNKPVPGAKFCVAFGLGYRKLITYTLPSESGVSLTAAGWRCIGEAGGGSWSRAARPRVDTHPLQYKMRWEVENTAVADIVIKELT